MAPTAERPSAKRILVPVKGEEVDEEALKLACELARGSRGVVYVLYVIQVKQHLPLDAEVAAETARGEAVLQQMESLGRGQGCQVHGQLLQARQVGPAVVREAVERDVNLVVAGLPYKKRYGAFSLGLTIPYLLKNAPCPVLIYRETGPEPGSREQGMPAAG